MSRIGDDLVSWHFGDHANPKTSGGARWNYLAAWLTRSRNPRNEQKAQDFVNGSTRTFRCSIPERALDYNFCAA